MELEMHPFPQTDTRSGQSDSDHHFFHTNVFLRHASGASGEADEHIDRILTQAAVAKRRVWVSSLLFAELRPSMFVPGRFGTLQELVKEAGGVADLKFLMFDDWSSNEAKRGAPLSLLR